MTFTRDATSNRPIPQSAAEFTSFLSTLSFAMGNPFMAHMFNQASGACVDLIGTTNLTVSGPFSGPSYSQTISGWASQGILFHTGNDDGADTTAAALPNIATESMLTFTWMEWPDPGSGVARSGISIGTYGGSPQTDLNARIGHDTIEIFTSTNGGVTSAAGWAGRGVVEGTLLGINRDVGGGGAAQGQNFTHPLGQLVSPGPAPSNTAPNATGKGLYIGNGNSGLGGSGIASGARAIYECSWKGTAAELTPTQLVELLDLWYDIGPPPVAGPYWGPHFPDAAGSRFYFGPHFPDGKPNPVVIPGSGPSGVATFALLEAGTKVTYSWATDVRKMDSGKEYRAQPLDDPRQTFAGSALLVGDVARRGRGQLAKFAALGAPFSLALPFESLSINADSVGMVVPTTSTASSDWMIKSQRVVVIGGNNEVVDAVIQDFGGTSVTLDVDPGALGKRGGSIAPVVPVFFDPQTGFLRHRGTEAVETWQINARHALFGFQTDARAAFAALSASAGALAAVVLQWMTIGASGNAVTIQMIGDAGLFPTHYLSNTGSAYQFHFFPGLTHVSDLIGDVTGLFVLAGTFDPSAVLTAGDVIGPIALHDGADKGYGTMGIGATVATYDGRPLWDRGIQVEDTATDSIQSLATLIDLGGVPLQIGTADAPDWGRQVMIERTSVAEWQWLKKFLATVRGRQVAFWLPTARPDLIAVSLDDPTTITIVGPSEESGDFAAWYPTLRDRLQVVQADGAITYAQITAAVDNLDGTMTLTVAPATAFTGAAITRLSWLELVHFDSDDFEVTFSAASFSMTTKARAVQQ